MYNVCDTDAERIYCLKQMLRINPKNEKANQLLTELNASDFPLERPVAAPKAAEPQPIPEQKLPPLPSQTQKPGVKQKPIDKKQQKNLLIGILATVIFCTLCVCIGVILNGNNSSTTSVSNTGMATVVATTSSGKTTDGNTNVWIPSGFNQWNNEIAFRYISGKPCSYASADVCAHAEVFTRYGCPNSLYVEAAFLDNSLTQVDWSNDTASSLSPGTKALLEFVSFKSLATKVKITKIECY